MVMKIGVLAIQGGFSLHSRILQKLTTETKEIRLPKDLDGIDGLIIPGGESTTLSLLMKKYNLFEPIKSQVRSGLPVWGTCAGAIMLGYGEGTPQPRFDLINVEISRNAYGRQMDSFVAPLEISKFSKDFPGVFIRAPKLLKVDSSVEILAYYKGEPVMALQDNILVTSFHPELTTDIRIHEFFIKHITKKVFADMACK
ncbi:MAG: pyridoxal 5'-phosphate synthase glutaminase subunit PdxT [Calditrichaeota bacterium]|jgi:pyridoxal 5'-phosphate synthase pdxT subunit|nr:pyridoxal 5'-phosphate synthase glutaminase subunit PdxT [Calditrichota bacterium]MBT7616354.1 pyridoxal 5'-phosphate synthase glutaminase subunit PdxT [Calditrichota bacterium]MBT7788582.1 pyridoxal 5'-phosphate synthase glutaminase subunit PdxT [Calditrichota bacterium]